MKFFIKSQISANLSKTREGFLVCKNVPITHLGAIEYQEGEHPFSDKVKGAIETFWDESIFSKETLASFEGKPVVIYHPEGDEDVKPENWKRLAVGIMVNVKRGADEYTDHLVCDLIIYDADAIELIESGEMREVSLGYTASWEYLGNNKAKRFKLRGNHCAIVDNGRAGVTCAIRDSKGENMVKKIESKWDKIKKALVKSVDEEKKKELEKLKTKKSKDSIDDEIEEARKKLAELKAKKAQEESADEEAEESAEGGEIEARLSKIEEAIAKIVSLIEGASEEESIDEDEEENEESIDEDEDEDGEVIKDEDEDEDEDYSKDAASIEILAPSKKFKGKDARLNALKEAYKTTDGKAVIDTFTNGKEPSGSKEFIDAVFAGSVALLKSKRSAEFSKTKKAKDQETKSSGVGNQKSPSELNQFYADYYKNVR